VRFRLSYRPTPDNERRCARPSFPLSKDLLGTKTGAIFRAAVPAIIVTRALDTGKIDCSVITRID
jgi:hypothetical protein